jgi:hypothetical protein
MIQFNGTHIYVLNQLNTRRNNKRYYCYAYSLHPAGFMESKSNLLEVGCSSEVLSVWSRSSVYPPWMNVPSMFEESP